MKKFLLFAVCPLLIVPAAPAAPPSSDDWGWWYLSLKGSYAMPDVSGTKERTALVSGESDIYDFSTKLKTTTDSHVGFKPAFGVQFNLPSIYGAIRFEAEYADWGTLTAKDTKSDPDTMVYDINTGNLIVAPKSTNFDVRARAINFNANYSIETGGRVRPYLGAGAGYNMLSINSQYMNGSYSGKSNKSANGVGYNFGAGLDIYLASSMTLDIGYRYSYFGKTDFDIPVYYNGIVNTVGLKAMDNYSMTVTAHEFTLGLRYQF